MSLPDWAPVVEAIDAAKRCLVVSHIDPEGDSLGSELALATLLGGAGKDVRVVNADRPPAKYAFLGGTDAIQAPEEVADVEFDTAFVVDCAVLERVGSVASLLDGLTVVNIDHHRSNERFGDVNYVAPSACATGFLIYKLAEHLKWPLTPEVAAPIYAAIITDTGNFRYASTSAETLRVAAHLVEVGGLDPSAVWRAVFGQKSLAALKLLEHGLRALALECGGRLGVIHLSRLAFVETGADEIDAEGIVNFAGRVEGVEASVLLVETKSGVVKASLRSEGVVDVDRVAAAFGGGGHRNAAGARLQGPLAEARRRVIEAFRAALGGE